MLYTYKDRIIGLDLVGYPGKYEDLFPLERIFTFQRANLKIYPLGYSEWVMNRAACESWLLSVEHQ